MTFDLYTKFVITVIAVSLLKIAFYEVHLIDIASASPANKVQKIAICNEYGTSCAQVRRGKFSVVN